MSDEPLIAEGLLIQLYTKILPDHLQYLLYQIGDLNCITHRCIILRINDVKGNGSCLVHRELYSQIPFNHGNGIFANEIFRVVKAAYLPD